MTMTLPPDVPTTSWPAHQQRSVTGEEIAVMIEEMNRDSSHLASITLPGRDVRLIGLLWATVRDFLIPCRQQRASSRNWQQGSEALCERLLHWLILAKRWAQSLTRRHSVELSPLERSLGRTQVDDILNQLETDHSSHQAIEEPEIDLGNLRRPTSARGPRQRFTVLLITKNEERRIRRCLASITWADRTVALCQAVGASVISRPFSGSFAEERNAGLEAAVGDWVLQMDADEIVTSQLRKAIERILADPTLPYHAYQVRRRNIFLGRVMRYGGWYHHHLCLFRREGHWYHGRVHEQLTIHGPVGILDADLQHEPFDSLEQFVARQNRYTSLQARELWEREGCLPWPTVQRNLWTKPLTRWWKFYVKKQGFREGCHGLVFSTLYAWLECVIWIKYCELACAASITGTSAEPHVKAAS